MSDAPIIRKHNKKLEKRCIKCRKWRLKVEYFGVHETSSDGYQSICKRCKGDANKKSQSKNVVARLRHHIASRCLSQLGEYAPMEFTKNLEKYLGYTIKALVRHLRVDIKVREGKDRSLRDAMDEGYHVDHIKPLSLYKVLIDPPELAGLTHERMGNNGDDENGDHHNYIDKVVDWNEFRECWTMENLTAIPGVDNLKKGAKYDDAEPMDTSTNTMGGS